MSLTFEKHVVHSSGAVIRIVGTFGIRYCTTKQKEHKIKETASVFIHLACEEFKGRLTVLQNNIDVVLN